VSTCSHFWDYVNEVTYIPQVLYYSNDILAKSLPEFGAYISLGITVINIIMSFPPIFLIEVSNFSAFLNKRFECAFVSGWGEGLFC